MKFFLIFLFIIILLIESTIFHLPLTVLFLLLLFVFKKSPEVFLYAFLAGIVLDILSVQVVGLTSIYFVTFLFLVSLYDRKYEIKTWPFVVIAGCVGSGLYAILIGV